jgi:polysaccharide deacetylase family protein (PEP-CTERM system associated)
MDLFDAREIRATFFVLGWVAERNADLVREIAGRGHEVACHGYSHELVYNQEQEVFREETARSKAMLEDITGTRVRGYRAASFSITTASRWALDILAEAGFEYDSSIFPIRHDRYGMVDAEPVPHHMETAGGRSLVEFPLSTARLLAFRLPVAGGGYFRLYPYALTRTGLRQVNRGNSPFIFYLHPWEIDPEQPRLNGSLFSRFRHYNNLDKCETRLLRLLDDFRFDSAAGVLEGLGLLPAAG